ncbi:MAG: hypothetical protein KatS3mg102_2553 [Planctomycetota bacterium]|nr:MAG: hypothetical protein KatS3mg102_2553 [Planctomycetota bacterium]
MSGPAAGGPARAGAPGPAPPLAAAAAPPAAARPARGPTACGQRARSILKLALAGALLWWLLASGRLEPGQLRRVLASGSALGLAIAVIGAGLLVMALRWWLLLRAVEVRLGFGRTLALAMIGHFFNTFLPGGAGGDAARMLYVAREAAPRQKLEAATTVAIDRLLGLASLVLVFLLGCAAQLASGQEQVLARLLAPLEDWLVVLAAAAGALALAVAAALHPRVHGSARLRGALGRLPGAGAGLRVMRTFLRTARSGRTVLLALLLSVAVHLAIVGCFLAFGRALGDTLGIAQYATIVPLGLLINAIPGPPQGLGVGELAFETLFGLATGTAGSVGTEVCLAWRLVQNGWNLVGGLFYVTFRSAGPHQA